MGGYGRALKQEGQRGTEIVLAKLLDELTNLNSIRGPLKIVAVDSKACTILIRDTTAGLNRIDLKMGKLVSVSQSDLTVEEVRGVGKNAGRTATEARGRINAVIHDKAHDRAGVPDREVEMLNQMTAEERKRYIKKAARQLQY